MAPNNSNIQEDMLIEWMKRLEGKFDASYTKLEERTDINYNRLVDMMDNNYNTLEKKINEYVENSAKNFDSIKDKISDHEYRLRGVEASNKETNNKMMELLSKNIDNNSNNNSTSSLFKKFTKIDTAVILVIIILIFISGNFQMINTIVTAFAKKW
jgi:hypothetical protein